MNNDKKCLIEILKAYLNDEKLNIDIDINDLYALSKGHNLAPIVFSMIKDKVNSDDNKSIYKAFQDSFYDAIVRYDTQKEIIDEMTSLFEINHIKYVLFKGAQIKEYYPTPELRVMGDVDVLIEKEQRNNAKALLTKNGFEIITSNGPVYSYKKDDVLIEVHTKIISGKVGSANAEDYFENAIDNAAFNGYYGSFNPNYHFEYLITHIAHHFWFYGAGVKLICDLAVMLKKYDIDLDLVINNLGDIHLDKFAKIIISICYKWFGIGKEYDVDTEETENFLLNYGAFGNVNRNKSAVISRKALEEGKNSSLAIKLGLLFPSYKKMKNIPYMTFMEGRPYLLPAGWIYRIFYNYKYKKEFVNNATSSIGSKETKGQAEAELLYFEEIGLI